MRCRSPRLAVLARGPGARRLGAVLLAAVLVAGCAPALRSGGAPPPATAPAEGPAAPAAPPDPLAPLPPLGQKLTISYSSVTSNFAPLYVAADAGLFTKNGLEVELTLIASGTTSIQSLIAGDVHFSVTAAPETAAAYVGGAPVTMLLSWTRSLTVLFLVDPSITRPEQLRGKTIGITRFGGQPHVAARLALKYWGLDPDNDVQYLQMGGTPEILAGMQQGVVVGGAYAPPTNLRAQRLGFRVLGDLSQMDIPYQGAGLIGTRPFLEANPEVARRAVRAILEGIKLAVMDEELTRAATGRYTRTDDPELLDEALRHFRNAVVRVPYPSMDALQAVLDNLADTEPRARAVRPEEMVTLTFLEQLDREGFIKALWGE
jgi:NitT/TauT family transport system substrate-binding protein